MDGVAGERLDRPPGQLRAEMLSPAGARAAGELLLLAPSPSLMLSNVRAYGEWKRKKEL